MNDAGLIGAALATHSPRMAAQAPAFMTELLEGARHMGELVREAAPDVLIVQSAHWLSTFHWYVTCQAVHEGMCVATEAPDLIPGIEYRRKGDPEMAEVAAQAIEAAGLRCGRNETAHFVWDYGSLVPLLFMDPGAELPVVLLSTCMAAPLDECRAVGGALAEAARKAGKRALFVASGALSHALVRNPEAWPTPERREMDQRFMKLLSAGDIAALTDWLPSYARESVAEVGGRHLATLLGALEGTKAANLRGEAFGYGQSSGSGNTNLLVQPVA